MAKRKTNFTNKPQTSQQFLSVSEQVKEKKTKHPKKETSQIVSQLRLFEKSNDRSIDGWCILWISAFSILQKDDIILEVMEYLCLIGNSPGQDSWTSQKTGEYDIDRQSHVATDISICYLVYDEK